MRLCVLQVDGGMRPRHPQSLGANIHHGELQIWPPCSPSHGGPETTRARIYGQVTSVFCLVFIINVVQSGLER